ncbi:MAG: glutamine amidotransferase [Opitutaceae bacterium]
MKGLETFNYGIWLKNALEQGGGNTVQSVPSWDFYKLPPGEYERIIAENDVLIFSDVEAKIFQLAPAFFDSLQFGQKPLTFPDRVRLTADAARKSGKGLVFVGGWYSFTGEMGKGGWGRTLLREILPVKCLAFEDLVESTEGFKPTVTAAGKAKLAGISFADCPPILGYNLTERIPEGEVLMEIGPEGAPLLALRKVGAGKVLAFTSDPAPHWGCNFVHWPEYTKFWQRCIDLVAPIG